MLADEKGISRKAPEYIGYREMLRQIINRDYQQRNTRGAYTLVNAREKDVESSRDTRGMGLIKGSQTLRFDTP